MKVPQVRLLTGTTAAAAALAVALGVSAGTATAAPAAARQNSSATSATASKGIVSQVTGTFRNKYGVGKFAGTFTPKKFSVSKGVLEVTGVLKGTMTNANGSRLGTVDRTATLPVSAAATKADPSTCGILNLILGPLHLNLLGLVVNLNRVHLTITAVSGSGNLLGNLLCDVAHLLDTGGSLSKIASLLNQILSLLYPGGIFPRAAAPRAAARGFLWRTVSVLLESRHECTDRRPPLGGHLVARLAAR